MTASGTPPDQPPPEWLEPAVREIERGNWRYVLHEMDSVAAHGEAAAFYVLLQTVAQTMRLQTLGDVAEAWRQLGIAARLLPRPMCRLLGDGITHKAVLRPKPSAGPGTRVLMTWRVARVIWREQVEVAALRTSLVQEHTTARDVLIDAMIEWMRWVECDPRTGDPRYGGHHLAGIGPSRAEFCTRATHLRRFVDPTAGDLSTTIWTKLGGYYALRHAAIGRLAGSELAPWTSENPMIKDIPVRLGRRRAWEHATEQVRDLQL